MHIDKNEIPTVFALPGATARQLPGFGELAAEYFTLAAGTDIAPLLTGLIDDACNAPHWGYLVDGTVVVTYTDGATEICTAGDVFYWPPGHSVRVEHDAALVLFSPHHQHLAVIDHMRAVAGAG
jgi:hypothetical protein